MQIGFPIATVQEYLAGCALAIGTPDIVAWFAHIVRRPWAQAIQFAIERTPGIEPALIVQLDSMDDVFHTSLRVIARSIVNGASVTPDFRRHVVDRLLNAWRAGGWRVKRDVGDLLASGLAMPATKDLIEEIVASGDGFSDGRLIVLLADRNIALRTLGTILAREDIRDLWSRHWIDAFKIIGPDCIGLLIERSKSTDALSEEVVAAALYGLRDITTVDWNVLSRRIDLPRRIRAACIWGAGLQNRPQGQAIISSFIDDEGREAVEVRKPCRFWHGFHKGYLHTTWWRDHLMTVIFGDSASELARSRIFAALIEVSYDEESGGVALVEELRHLVSMPSGRVALIDAVLCVATFGDHDVGATVIDRLSMDNVAIVQYWIRCYPYFSEDLKAVGLQRVRQILHGSPHELDSIGNFLGIVDFVPSERRAIAPHGPLQYGNPTAAAKENLLKWAMDYLATMEICHERSLLLAQIIEAGGHNPNVLAQELEVFARRGVLGGGDDWSWVWTAVVGLEERGCPVASETLFALAKMFDGFPTHRFFSILLKREGSAISDRLCLVFKDAGKSTRAQILSALEDVAQSLGLLVKWAPNGGLQLEWMS